MTIEIVGSHLTLVGATAQIEATNLDDVFELDLTAETVTINGTTYQLPENATSVEFDGGLGNDRFTLLGTSGDEAVRLLKNVGLLDSSAVGLTGSFVGMETIVYVGNGGGDTARLIDSAGDDTLVAGPARSRMSGAGYANLVLGVGDVTAISNRGGSDVATLNDSTGDDRFVSRSGSAALTGTGFSLQAIGFSQVSGVASSGDDRAILSGGVGDDEVTSRPTVTTLSDGSQSFTVSGFDTLTIDGQGGSDSLNLFGDGNVDTLSASPTEIVASGSGGNRFFNHFENLVADGAGGNDKVTLQGSAHADTLVLMPNFAQLQGTSFDLRASNYERTYAYGNGGTGDRAILYDTTGDDSFFGEGAQGDLQGPNYLVRTNSFGTITLKGTNGGTNRLRLTTPISFELRKDTHWA